MNMSKKLYRRGYSITRLYNNRAAETYRLKTEKELAEQIALLLEHDSADLVGFTVMFITERARNFSAWPMEGE
jgi:hypothetical protein